MRRGSPNSDGLARVSELAAAIAVGLEVAHLEAGSSARRKSRSMPRSRARRARSRARRRARRAPGAPRSTPAAGSLPPSPRVRRIARLIVPPPHLPFRSSLRAAADVAPLAPEPEPPVAVGRERRPFPTGRCAPRRCRRRAGGRAGDRSDARSRCRRRRRSRPTVGVELVVEPRALVGRAVVRDLHEVDAARARRARASAPGRSSPRSPRKHARGTSARVDVEHDAGVVARRGAAAAARAPASARRRGGPDARRRPRPPRAPPRTSGPSDAVGSLAVERTVETVSTGPTTAAAPPTWSGSQWVSTSRSMRVDPEEGEAARRARRDRGRCRRAPSRPRSGRGRRRPARRRTRRRPSRRAASHAPTTGAPSADADRHGDARPRASAAAATRARGVASAGPSTSRAGERGAARRAAAAPGGIRKPRAADRRAARDAPCATSAIHDAGSHATWRNATPTDGSTGRHEASEQSDDRADRRRRRGEQVRRHAVERRSPGRAGRGRGWQASCAASGTASTDGERRGITAARRVGERAGEQQQPRRRARPTARSRSRARATDRRRAADDGDARARRRRRPGGPARSRRARRSAIAPARTTLGCGRHEHDEAGQRHERDGDARHRGAAPSSAARANAAADDDRAVRPRDRREVAERARLHRRVELGADARSCRRSRARARAPPPSPPRPAAASAKPVRSADRPGEPRGRRAPHRDVALTAQPERALLLRGQRRHAGRERESTADARASRPATATVGRRRARRGPGAVDRDESRVDAERVAHRRIAPRRRAHRTGCRHDVDHDVDDLARVRRRPASGDAARVEAEARPTWRRRSRGRDDDEAAATERTARPRRRRARAALGAMQERGRRSATPSRPDRPRHGTAAIPASGAATAHHAVAHAIAAGSSSRRSRTQSATRSARPENTASPMPGDLEQLVDARERAVGVAPVDDALGERRADAGQRVERRDVGGVQVHRPSAAVPSAPPAAGPGAAAAPARRRAPRAARRRRPGVRGSRRPDRPRR